MPYVSKLDAKTLRFVNDYSRCGNALEAGKRQGFTRQETRKLLTQKDVEIAVARRRDLIDREQVRLDAKMDLLQTNLLDAELVSVIMLPAKGGGAVKLRAIEMGYERLGIRREGEYYVPSSASTEKTAAAPSMYRAMERKTTTTTTEEVRELQVSAATALAAPRPVLSDDLADAVEEVEPLFALVD